MIRYIHSTILIFGLIFPLLHAQAQQKDTTKRTIDITSSFKPVLRNAAKINFHAAPPSADTTRPRFSYTIPDQGILPALQPASLTPVPFKVDSLGDWSNRNTIKLGYGNLRTPFLQAGFSFGDQQTRIAIHADHISSKGKIENQEYGRTYLRGDMYTPVSSDLELHAAASFQQDKYFLYGYDHSQYAFTRSELLNRFSTVAMQAGIRNTAATKFGIWYKPDLKISLFADSRRNKESNAVLDLPLEKTLGRVYTFKLGFRADMSRFSPDAGKSITNNLYTFPVALNFNTPNARIQGGATPSWDNGQFKLLPNFLFEFPILHQKWVIQAGWIGYYNKGTYQHFESVNPYLSVPTEFRNNRMTERFVGFRGTLLGHFTYSAKIAGVEYRNLPLFVNDTGSGKSYRIIYEQLLKAVQIHGELGYVQGETFTLHAGMDWFSYNSQSTEPRPWGMVPFDLTAKLRWMIIKDLWLTSDLYIWDGSVYKDARGGNGRVGGGIDLNAGLEFRIASKISLWTQFNNITNSRYQRWYQYDRYGFNMLAGARFTF
jgi:hypothetical protein